MYRQIAIFWFCAFATGCAAREIHLDQDKIRTTLLDLYTNQIIDNLVQASNGLPIIQIDYTNASANVTYEETASLSDAYQTTNTSALTTAAKMSLAVTHQIVNTLTCGLTANHTNSVALTANPVLTNNEIYNAYLEFLGIPGSLQVTDMPPPAGAAHVCKQYRKLYYWVPVECKQAFFDLALLTMAQRDRLLQTPERYSVTLEEVDPKSIVERGPEYWIDVKIDKTIPNEGGAEDVAIEGADGFLELLEFNPHPTVDDTPKPTEKPKQYYVRVRKSADPGEKDQNYFIDEAGKGWLVTTETGSHGRVIYKKSGKEFIHPSQGDDFLPDATTTVYATNRLRFLVTRKLFDRLMQPGGLPLPVRFKLQYTPPPPPTTSELLDQVPFRFPQIKIETAPEKPTDSSHVPPGNASPGNVPSGNVPPDNVPPGSAPSIMRNPQTSRHRPVRAEA
ncbi:MAG TPA: hypothetical protein VGM05_10610 [Planctomycetaceae bacterium]